MIRKQLYIDEDLNDALKVLAGRTRRSEAEHVRAALAEYLSRRQRERAGDGDPLLELIGIVDDGDGPRDVADRHDHYLYGTG